MEFKYEDRIKMIEIIDNVLDIANYEHPYVVRGNQWSVYHHGHGKLGHNLDFYEKITKINEEIRERGIFSDRHNLKIKFDDLGKIRSIYIELDIYDEPQEINKVYEIDNCEVTIKRKDSFSIVKKKELEFEFSPDEWKNYKRTKLIEDMLK